MAKEFVCVRLQSMNGVDLGQFPFEYDLTWMSFFRDSEGRTYTRYGGREDDDAESHLTKASLLRVMNQVLDLHKKNAVQPVGKYEPLTDSVDLVDDIPTMRNMIAKRDVSCIHCHDVKVARLKHQRELGKLDKDMVFTYPSPRRIGIEIERDRQNVIAKVHENSSASLAGLRAGDVIEKIDGQRVLTFADATRILELAPESGDLKIAALRNDDSKKFNLRLKKGWRKSEGVAWRASVGAVGPSGGFWGVKANAKQRADLDLAKDDLAIRVTFIWAKHARAAGIKHSDVVVAVDGQKHDMDMRELHAHLQMNRTWGDEINLDVIRKGKKTRLKMKLGDES